MIVFARKHSAVARKHCGKRLHFPHCFQIFKTQDFVEKGFIQAACVVQVTSSNTVFSVFCSVKYLFCMIVVTGAYVC